MNFWRFRVDSFGSPFRNVNSGRNTEADVLNNARLQLGTERYLTEFKSNFQKKKIKIFLKKKIILKLLTGQQKMHFGYSQQ